MALVPSAITPPKVVLVPLAPAVRVAALPPLLLMVPVPSKPSMVMLLPLTSRVPALLIVTELLAERPAELPMASVPALMVVAPENVLLPERVRVPVPVLVRATVPAPFTMFPVKVEVWSAAPAVRMAAAELFVTRPCRTGR